MTDRGVTGMWRLVGLLAEGGLVPDAAAGLDSGELVALSVAGVFDASYLEDLLAVRTDALLAAAGDDPGRLIAITADREVIEALFDDLDVVVAGHHDPRGVVVAGPTAAIGAAIDRLRPAGYAARRIVGPVAAHSPVVAAAEAILADHLAGVALAAPTIPVYSNLTAAPYPTDASGIRRHIAAQLRHTVRFAEQIQTMHDDGIRTFVEIGAGRVLTTMIGRILAGQPHVVVACDRPDSSAAGSVADTVARLAPMRGPAGAGVSATRRDAAASAGIGRPVSAAALRMRHGVGSHPSSSGGPATPDDDVLILLDEYGGATGCPQLVTVRCTPETLVPPGTRDVERPVPVVSTSVLTGPADAQ